jgi:hypothetical protein
MRGAAIRDCVAAAARILTVSKLTAPSFTALRASQSAPRQASRSFQTWCSGQLKIRKLLSPIALECHSMTPISGCSRGFSVGDHSI